MATPNDLTNYIVPLLALSMKSFRAKSVLPLLANHNNDPAPGAKGSSVQITIASAITATDVVPGHVAPDTGPLVPTTMSLVVDQWKEAAFTLTDSDLMKVSAGVIPKATEQAVISLSRAIETEVYSNFLGVPGMNGTPGTTPFAVSATTGMNDMTAYIAARAALNLRDVPEESRFALINSDAAGNLLNGRQFIDAAWANTDLGILKGKIGTKLGADWVESNRVSSNVSTALTAGALTVNGVNAAGAATVSLAKATNAAPLKAGNTITIATGPAAGVYRVTADTTLIVGNTAVPITPVLRGATAGAEAVTLLATAMQNVLFQSDAIGFVTRPLSESTPSGAGGLGIFETIIDPPTGLTLRLELTREYKQYRWSLDCLWGSMLVRPDYAQIMNG